MSARRIYPSEGSNLETAFSTFVALTGGTWELSASGDYGMLQRWELIQVHSDGSRSTFLTDHAKGVLDRLTFANTVLMGMAVSDL